MNIKNKKIGFVITGSFYSFKSIIPKVKELIKKDAYVLPIMSYNSYNLNNKNIDSKNFIKNIESITGNKIIHTISEAENIGRKKLTDVMIVCPCSENTISKLAFDIIDTPATVAVRSHLRNNLPLIIAPSSLNGLSSNAISIATLLNRKNYYFVPFGQNNPITKPTSIMFKPEYIIESIELALNNEQIQPILM